MNNTVEAVHILETLRSRAMYGDNYSDFGPNTWQATGGEIILAAAINHILYGRSCYTASTVEAYTDHVMDGSPLRQAVRATPAGLDRITRHRQGADRI